jgi:plastocyanin
MTVTAEAPAAIVARGRSAYTRLGAVGLGLGALAPLTFVIAGLVTGVPISDLMFFLITAAILLAGAAAVWWLGMVGKVLGIVAGVLVGFALFWMAFGLRFPAAFVDFVPGVLLPLGLLLGVGGSIAGIASRKRPGPTWVETRLVAGALGLVVLAAAASAVITLVSRTTIEPPAGAVTSTMEQFEFVEGTYEVQAGQPTTIVVHNADPAVHDFTIPALGIAETINPGSDAAITLTAEPGTYTIYCTLHSDTGVADPEAAGMAARLVVG